MSTFLRPALTKWPAPISTWSLRSIAGYVKEKKLIKDDISHTAIRDILIEYGVEWRHSKHDIAHHIK